jgi:hypothetical protein
LIQIKAKSQRWLKWQKRKRWLWIIMTLCKDIWIGALTLVAVATATLSPARSDEYPTLNVSPLCHALTDKSSFSEGLANVTFEQCLEAEQSDRKTIIKEWSTFSADDRRHCIAEATMGGESSYTEMLTCLEMARDVRQLKSETASSAPTPAVPAPPGHRQPTPH